MTRSLRLLVVTLMAIGAGALVYLAFQPKTPPAFASRPFHIVTDLAKPTQPSALWVGDSYTAGTGAPDVAHSEAGLTSTAMGWICNDEAEGGSGFINNGHDNSVTFKPLIKRIPQDKATYLADIVIIDAGRNDGSYPLPKVERAVAKYDAAIHAAYPKAQLVEIVPFFMFQSAESYGGQLATFIRHEMAIYHGHTIDPIAEGWVSDAKTGSMTIADHTHPNPAGHIYIAKHLVADLRADGLSHVPVTDYPQG